MGAGGGGGVGGRIPSQQENALLLNHFIVNRLTTRKTATIA